ncbi:urease accessory protein UreE [Tianweitania sediminis]|uniref:Urease accessory protein UreE n=1 Tax=Tianweitania sediminis TaxID=1502156 RepID=A0A8J7RHF0_9HYPH|nr:urease accessory protein UreE [Tianweitania sediminis]MBP0437286.1 urease accessory protein UreE [Tianweitania sediminis]HEV7417535.1 urease accessory protein UreE [Tianweitania sediminis]
MKLSLNTDFTQLPRAGTHVAAASATNTEAFDRLLLEHDERSVRRRVVSLHGGSKILVDLPDTTELRPDDILVLDDGRAVKVEAAAQDLLAIRPQGAQQLGELCWHLGSRHALVAVSSDQLLVLPDTALEVLLDGLGVTVEAVRAPFQPVAGVAHSAHAHHHHDHAHHGHDHGHAHGHGELDAFGRKPGDPHYGHSHP